MEQGLFREPHWIQTFEHHKVFSIIQYILTLQILYFSSVLDNGLAELALLSSKYSLKQN